jgi:hypothetical protein
MFNRDRDESHHKHGMESSASLQAPRGIGDLKTVVLEIGSHDPRHVRDATYVFHRLFERVMRMPSPERKPTREYYLPPPDAAPTRCKRGHLRVLANLTPDGVCRQCKAARARARETARRKAAR